MKAKKRFVSEAQIIAAIDECHAQSKANLKAAQELEEKARKAIHSDESELVEQAKYDLAQVSKMRRSADRLIDVKARKLGEKLAIMRTELMPPILDDRSIPA